MSDLRSIITQAANQYGLSPEMMLRFAQIESGMNPNAANPTSSARGVYQFLTKPGSTWSRYGAGKDPLDATANVDAGARYTLDNQNALRAHLGREPAPWEVYLAHQQGNAGARALLANPNRPATEVLQAFYSPQTANKVITGNAGRADMTAGDFANLWKAKYEGTPVPAAGGGGKVLEAGGVAPVQGAGGVTNPVALVQPQNQLGSVFAEALAPALKPPDTDPKVRRPRIGHILDGLGAPVRLSV